MNPENLEALKNMTEVLWMCQMMTPKELAAHVNMEHDRFIEFLEDIKTFVPIEISDLMIKIADKPRFKMIMGNLKTGINPGSAFLKMQDVQTIGPKQTPKSEDRLKESLLISKDQVVLPKLEIGGKASFPSQLSGSSISPSLGDLGGIQQNSPLSSVSEGLQSSAVPPTTVSSSRPAPIPMPTSEDSQPMGDIQPDKLVNYANERIYSSEANVLHELTASLGGTLDFFITNGHVIGLNIVKKDLSELPSKISVFGALETLKLSGNQLTTLPFSIGSLKNLEILDVSNNALVSLPESLGMLLNLKELKLRQNLLTSLPNSIGMLQNLRILDLAKNNVTSLPFSFLQLKNLEILWLRENSLTKLPGNIDVFKQLQVLDLMNNNLSQFPRDLSKMPYLQNISINGNQELILSEEEFNQLEGMKYLGCKVLMDSSQYKPSVD